MSEVRQEQRPPSIRSTARKQSWTARFIGAALPPLVRGVGRLAWRLEIDGNSFPEPPFVVAANHLSFLDPFLIGAALDEKIRFLALIDLFGNYRLVDFALEVFDVIPVRRGAVPLGPVRTALAHLGEGRVIGLFPEGTRHYEFKPEGVKRGAAWLAVSMQVPLVPVAIAGTDTVLGVDNRLRRGRIRLTVGPSLHATGKSKQAVDELMSCWVTWIHQTLHAG